MLGVVPGAGAHTVAVLHARAAHADAHPALATLGCETHVAADAAIHGIDLGIDALTVARRHGAIRFDGARRARDEGKGEENHE